MSDSLWRQHQQRHADTRADGTGESDDSGADGAWLWDLEEGPRGLPREYL